MDDSNDPSALVNDNEPGRIELPAARLEVDELFEVLSHQRRRYVLYALLADDSRSLEELAESMAAWENRVPEDGVNREEIEKVYASLCHAHIPKLVDYGIIGFDRRDETITKKPIAKQVLDLLVHTGASEAEQMERHARRNIDDG